MLGMKGYRNEIGLTNWFKVQFNTQNSKHLLIGILGKSAPKSRTVFMPKN